MKAGDASTKEVVDRLYEAFGAGDLERMAGLMADDVVVTFLAQGTFTGLPAFERFLAFSDGLLGDLDWRLERIVVDGEIACGLWEETATTADGQPWHTTGVDVIRVVDGKVASLAMNNDAALTRRHFPRYVDAAS